MTLHRREEKENKDTNTTVPNKTQFVCKDIVKKKKNPQQKLERYFPVTKQKQPKIEKNFQGFPLTECIYEEEIDKYVYKPTDYPSAGTTNPKQQHSLCNKCFLRPCFVKGKWDDLMGFCEDIMVFENDDSESMYFKMLNHAEAIQVELFGVRYARNNLLPECVNEIVGKYLSIKSRRRKKILTGN